MFGRWWFEPLRERLFAKGDLKYVVLDLLNEKPRHGYEVIRALEERCGGFYAPSPGAVYPVLQLLEDLGLVAAAQQDGKKVYSVTDEGRAFLAQRQEVVEDIWKRTDDCWGGRCAAGWRDLARELRLLGWLIRHHGRHRHLSQEQLGRAREIIARARREVEDVLAREV